MWASAPGDREGNPPTDSYRQAPTLPTPAWMITVRTAVHQGETCLFYRYCHVGKHADFNLKSHVQETPLPPGGIMARPCAIVRTLCQWPPAGAPLASSAGSLLAVDRLLPAADPWAGELHRRKHDELGAMHSGGSEVVSSVSQPLQVLYIVLD